MQNMILTQKYKCGPYMFKSYLPRIGLSTDQPVWKAEFEGEPLQSSFSSLEDAMMAAIAEKAKGKS